MGKAAPLLIWAVVLAIGAGAATRATRRENARALLAAAPHRQLGAAEAFAAARLVSPETGAESQGRLWLAAALDWRPPPPPPAAFAVSSASASAADAMIGPPDGAAKLLSEAMERAPKFGLLRPLAPPTALAALDAATKLTARSNAETPTAYGELAPDPSAYGELTPDLIAPRRLTILQLGDSHTAADFFSGRVRERLQEVFGTGGEAYLVPGRPHIGVRSALFESDASDGWDYEALQRSEDSRRFYLSGFNAVSRHAGAELTLRSRGGRTYDHAEVAFLDEPGGGRAEVDLDGSRAGEIDLDGAADKRATLALDAHVAGDPNGFHEITVKALSDGPVAVADVDVSRDGDGVSYLSVGFPGATVDLLRRLSTENLAKDFRDIEPDVIVLAFGTNEGFNDNLDVAAYAREYEQIVRRLTSLRPGVQIVIIGPPDAARPHGACHGAGVGQDCKATAVISAGPGGGLCPYPVPPKLDRVRDAQREIAEKLGAYFWDWSAAMPQPCGAQIWAAANPPLMARDYVHMTLEGYKRSADQFADFLIPLIQGRPTSEHVVSNY